MLTLHLLLILIQYILILILEELEVLHTQLQSGLNQWKMNLEEFSEQPNTAIKISGICVPDKKWTVKLNKEIILDVINIFGYERCMFASNFPVDSLCATFDEIYNGFKNITAGLPENEIQCLFHDNAIKYYNPS